MTRPRRSCALEGVAGGFPSLHGTEPRRLGKAGLLRRRRSRGAGRLRVPGGAGPARGAGGGGVGWGGERARLRVGISSADTAPPAARLREDGARLVAGNRLPSQDPPSIVGRDSGPEDESWGAGSPLSPRGIALPFSQAAGAPSTWYLRGRTGGDKRGRCPTAWVGKDRGSPLDPKFLLQLHGGRVGHLCERKDFCLFSRKFPETTISTAGGFALWPQAPQNFFPLRGVEPKWPG